MVERKHFTREEIARGRDLVDAALSAHAALVDAVEDEAPDGTIETTLADFDVLYFNDLALALDRLYVNRAAKPSSAGSSPLAELERLVKSIIRARRARAVYRRAVRAPRGRRVRRAREEVPGLVELEARGEPVEQGGEPHLELPVERAVRQRRPGLGAPSRSSRDIAASAGNSPDASRSAPYATASVTRRGFAAAARARSKRLDRCSARCRRRSCRGCR